MKISQRLLILCIFISTALSSTIGLSSDTHESSITPTEALQKLMEGNRRFTSGKSKHSDQDAKRREETAKGQKPFAVVLTCSDSRVSPEILFDQGLGDIFVARVAGNIVTPEILGSIEYAIDHLKAPLIVVLGHEKCGAVEASLAGGKLPGHIGTLTKAIQPALHTNLCPKDALLACAIRQNAEGVVQQLKSSKPILSEYLATGKLAIVGGLYHLESGEVSLLDAK